MLYPSGMKKKLRELAAELSVTQEEFDLVTVKNRKYYVHRYEGNLNGIENAIVLLSYPEKAFGNSKALRAFISTNVALSTPEILSSKGIQIYWLLMSMAHHICVVGTGQYQSFQEGYQLIRSTIQLEKYQYLFQCAKFSADFEAFMKLAG